ncbi:heme-thiolate peroxidase aromatic peroxygenase [Suillus paluster]|uniref:heme-thiolate peroxidase aromatic peroxygenase n=1 Tax=Suillus paluster TaxID=48578 RepID=UPI001B8629D8|nr:heme-thiolate peroxidase aromatic peroxygenase [Suillus paluster]KAG1722646.1 heme-thiolate peroxidase aromatic peroxygenase [Suillus paluster]
MGLFSGVSQLFFNIGIMSWDVLLTLLNLVRKKRRIGHVTPKGHPGYGGHWPEFRPPQETDSRCSCPALNAMANHGIISRTGRGISFVELNHHLRATYNFSPTFCSFVPHFAARMLKKSYSNDTFDLEEIDLHNGIEHDASLIRLDAAFEPDQSKKHLPFIEEVLTAATGKDKNGNDVITPKDLCKMLSKRRAVARVVNKEFSLSLFHKIFGSTNASTLVTIFGGRVDDLRSFLLDERIPEGWESRVRQPYGMTLMNFNKTILGVEFGVCENDWMEIAREGTERHASGTTPD